MIGLSDVISIESRRSKRPGGPSAEPSASRPPTAPPLAERRRHARRFFGGLLVVIVVLTFVDRSVVSQARTNVARAASTLPAAVRHGLYERTLADIEDVCGLPEARSGTLRQHCVEQARFALDLPECTSDCARRVRMFLVHGR